MTVLAVGLLGGRQRMLEHGRRVCRRQQWPPAFINESDVVVLVVYAPSSHVSCVREAR
jgi:hypothetical protein